jgi:selenocysteine-specific elongation factor
MNPIPKSIIVGTAGHIDHGKSTLIEALTGTHPDRLEEEKRRGITIDLGFAFLEENGLRLGFVDVPGHERFVKNMLAGASGIDLVLLAIAADEAIRPQTREHFDICRLLGVQRGIIVLTKSDLVDAEALELVRLEVEDFVSGSFLAGAPIISISAKTGAGIAELKQALQTSAAAAPNRNSERYFRLPVDRSFPVKGFGTVVTGTLISGELAVGDEVELLPQKEKYRVRGLQTGGKSVERAAAGQRTAVNLSGVEHTAVRRGMTLSAPGRLRPTRRVDVRLELLANAPKLKHRARVHFHTGTAETVGEVLLLEGAELLPGQNALAQIRLQENVVAVRNDRFIIRQFSPVITIGGGEVLDPLARRPTRKDSGRVEFLKILESGNPDEIVSSMTQRSLLGLAGEEIISRTGWQQGEVQTIAARLAEEKTVRIISSEPLLLLGEKQFQEICEKLRGRVERFHTENPLLPGIPREDLRNILGKRVRQEIFRAAIEQLSVEKKIVAAGELVKLPGAGITLTAQEQQAKEQIEQAFAKTGLAVPSVNEVLAKLTIERGRTEKLLQILLKDKVLIRVSPELVFHSVALNNLIPLLQAYKKSKGERIGVPAFKELTGITRKYAIPLLEYLDRQRLTRRAGDERVILIAG